MSRTMYGVDLHDISDFYENLIAQIFQGVVNTKDRTNHGPDVLIPEWERCIELKASSNMGAFGIRLEQLKHLLANRWQKKLDPPYNTIHWKRGFYGLCWWRNGERNPETQKVQCILPRYLNPDECLAMNTMRIGILDADIVWRMYKSGKYEITTERQGPDNEVPAMKLNGSVLSAFEKSPGELLTALDLEPRRYKVFTCPIEMEFKNFPMSFTLTIVWPRSFGLDFKETLFGLSVKSKAASTS